MAVAASPTQSFFHAHFIANTPQELRPVAGHDGMADSFHGLSDPYNIPPQAADNCVDSKSCVTKERRNLVVESGPR